MKWGFLGFGRIAVKFLSSLDYMDGESCYALASRSNHEKLKKAYPNYHIYSDYQALCQDPEVEIIYISTTHNFHYEQVMMALRHDKHVICEKPLATNVSETKEMIELARERNLFLMEALWMRFLPAYRKVQEMLPQIGRVRLIKADFAFAGNEFSPDRLQNPKLAGGSVYDVGVYPIALITDIYREEPEVVHAAGEMSQEGVDLSCNVICKYSGGQMAEFFSSVAINTEHHAYIYGDKGHIKMHVFWKCQKFEINLNGECRLIEIPFEDTGFVHEIRDAVSCIKEGKIESNIFSHEDSLRSARLVENILNQIGYIRQF